MAQYVLHLGYLPLTPYLPFTNLTPPFLPYLPSAFLHIRILLTSRRLLQELLAALNLPTGITVGQYDALQGATGGSAQVRPAIMGLSAVACLAEGSSTCCSHMLLSCADASRFS